MFTHTYSQLGDKKVLPRRCCASIAFGAAALLSAMGIGTAAIADSPVLGPLTRISSPSPFGGCAADDVPGQEADGSVVFRNSEVEPYVHVNPTDPDNAVAVWQQDRWSDGGSRGLVSAVTDDRGETWTTVEPPEFSLCSDGIFERATDPWITFGPSGNAYFMSLSFDSDPAIFGGHHAMLVSKSVDGGHSWDQPVTLIEEDDPLAFNDKNSMTADSTNANLVYAIWDRLELFEITPPQLEALSADVRFEHDRIVMAGRLLREMRLAAAADVTTQATPPEFKGPTYFTRSTDGGATWALPHIIHDPGADNQTINNIIEVMPNGRLIAFFTEILNTNQGPVVNIALKRSDDQGFSFTPIFRPIRAHRIFTNAIFASGTFTPDLQQPVRDGGLLFDPAVDPNNGTLYLAWQDNRFNGVDQVAFSQSTDGGRNWSPPIKISKSPSNSNIFRTQAFVPTVEVNSEGIIAVTYYDFRRDDLTGELTDQWIIFCDPAFDRCDRANSWKHERRLTTRPFDFLVAPNAGGLFLGDYEGLAAADIDFLPVFGIADGPGKSSIFVRRVTPATITSALTE